MHAPWTISLFGALSLHPPQQPSIQRFKTRKVAGLLAYLAFYLRREHPREVAPKPAPDSAKT